jgi:uncharacterized protein
MSDAGGTRQRIATLDIVRGVAVMGILAMNIVDFAMPSQAYVNPMAYGMDGTADFLAWLGGFIFLDGKMRGLFSFLFGASILLVIERAEAKEEMAEEVHFRRMAWLAAFGLAHFYLIWHGDILFGYAVCGMVAFLFRGMAPRKLVRWGIALIALQFLVFAGMSAALAAGAAPDADPALRQEAAGMIRAFGVPSGAENQRWLDHFRGGYGGILRHRLFVEGDDPFSGLMLFSWETLGFMALGMAALKSGFLTGAWAPSAYRRVAVACFAIAVPLYGLIAWAMIRAGFEPVQLFFWWSAATVPVRPVMIFGTAALIVLATGRGGWLTGRIAAAGRVAFTNYLGTSILMTTLFFGYGFGLFGHLSRAELWLVILPMWALMLAWSKPWLKRYRYGPFEWLWRSLARGEMQPLRRGSGDS